MKAADDFDIFLKDILNIIKSSYKVDFSLYKLSCLKRRIKRRMLLTKRNDIKDYLIFLMESEEERKILYDTITINVTRFFRDSATYTFVVENLLPHLKDKKNINVWSAGCSSGEEPYSLAMLLEYFKINNGLLYEYKIYATDIDSHSLELAKKAVYTPKSILNMTSKFKEIFDTYTIKEGNYYTVKEQIKNNVIFKQESIFHSQWKISFELIFCRNVFIYFNRDLQNKALSIFYNYLGNDGYLVLGRVETIFSASREKFDIISNRDKIYKKKIGV